MVQAIILYRLKHDHIVRFMGLYKQQRQRMELTYIVSPWMEHGNIAHYMHNTEHERTKIPRIRWVSFRYQIQRRLNSSGPHQILDVASGLRYLHDECIIHGNLNEASFYRFFTRSIIPAADWHDS